MNKVSGVLIAVAMAACLCGPVPASGQGLPRIWDVPLGTHVSDLPEDVFVDPSCGTNGGPAGLAIGSFEAFEKCRPEPSGLREVWFIYDDELEFMALATRDPMLIERSRATQVLGQPVILSFLVDDAGLVQGYRIFTDPRADPTDRIKAYLVANALRSRAGRDGWICADEPLAEGETPIGLTSVKQRCEKTADSRAIVTWSRHYYRRGQSVIDPRTNMPTENDFESSASFELVALQPAARVTPEWDIPVVAEMAPVGAVDQRAAFIAGITNDCPGCDLTGLSFKRRDLAGANLAGANLENASFYRAVLREADLSGANLTRANFNRADLTLAILAGARMDGAMLYMAAAPRADFSDASMIEAMMGRADLTLTTFGGANLEFADLGRARLTNADLAGINLDSALMDQTVLIRADLTGVSAQFAYMVEANLRYAKLAGARLQQADLTGADLGDSDLTSADLTGAKLSLANLHNARTDGAALDRAVSPAAAPR